MTDRYIVGCCRNEPNATKAHLYKEVEGKGLMPLCGYGWNRADGHAFSIFRGHGSSKGTCRLCENRAEDGLGPRFPQGFPHKTKWI